MEGTSAAAADVAKREAAATAVEARLNVFILKSGSKESHGRHKGRRR